ncbi:MAG TPA: NAD-dependent epimerase/dehydratase family protein [Acidimicrobiales bacterium]|nr:NAD-dependent epimerase/dehydratase family protein [Acidimicrobiales bacterium]
MSPITGSTVVVTGAAGNLGRRVTASLAARPTVERVLAVDMVPMPATAPEVEAHAFDLSAPGAQDELAALAKRADVLVHLAWDPEGKQNLRALEHVLEAAEAIEPAQLVHLSSGTVYGAWPDNAVPLTEELTPRPNAELAYAVEKRAAEELVEKWSRAHPDIAMALLRPACTVGSTEQPLYQALATTTRPPLGAEGRIVQYLHVNDLASAVVHACEKGLSGIYNVAPDNGVREEVAGALAGGSASLPLSAPVRAALAELRWRLWRRAAPPGAGPYAEHTWVIAGDKLRATGWRPEYSSEQALVVSDERAHWDELPPNRRVSAALAAGAATMLAAGAGGAMWWRHRR